jgi:hypothetical protein
VCLEWEQAASAGQFIPGLRGILGILLNLLVDCWGASPCSQGIEGEYAVPFMRSLAEAAASSPGYSSYPWAHISTHWPRDGRGPHQAFPAPQKTEAPYCCTARIHSSALPASFELPPLYSFHSQRACHCIGGQKLLLPCQTVSLLLLFPNAQKSSTMLKIAPRPSGRQL